MITSKEYFETMHFIEDLMAYGEMWKIGGLTYTCTHIDKFRTLKKLVNSAYYEQKR